MVWLEREKKGALCGAPTATNSQECIHQNGVPGVGGMQLYSEILKSSSIRPERYPSACAGV